MCSGVNPYGLVYSRNYCSRNRISEEEEKKKPIILLITIKSLREAGKYSLATAAEVVNARTMVGAVEEEPGGPD